MKRIAALLTALCLLLAQALAETTIDPKEARNIPLTEAGENETPDGISPTTGRTLSKLYVPEGYAGLAATGRYLPMLVQIGNDGGGVGNRAPWGVAYADILYETPLTRSHETRITAVFSDMIPDSVGGGRERREGGNQAARRGSEERYLQRHYGRHELQALLYQPRGRKIPL